MPDDPLSAALDEIRETLRLADGPAANDGGHGFWRRNEVLYHQQVPRLLAAVDAAIRYHTTPQTRRRNGRLVCALDSELMPCLHMQAISRALLGEDSQ